MSEPCPGKTSGGGYNHYYCGDDCVYKELKEKVNGISAEDFTVNPDRYDMVTNPMHYTVGGYEALDVIKAKLSPEEWRGAMKFNVLKYLMRANYKGNHDQDCKKAEFYAKELSNALLEKESPSYRADEKQVREEDSNAPPF